MNTNYTASVNLSELRILEKTNSDDNLVRRTRWHNPNHFNWRARSCTVSQGRLHRPGRSQAANQAEKSRFQSRPRRWRFRPSHHRGVAASGAWHGLSSRLRAGCRGNRPDRGDRAVGIAHRLRGSRGLAGRCPHRRQRLADPFRSETLSLMVASVLSETGLDPRRLELEITEAVLIADDDAALATLNQLPRSGFTSRSTILEPAIPRCSICSASRSTRSRSTAPSSRK